MKNLLVKVVKDFLSIHYQEGRPLLIGYSGGVDSTALLSLLLECCHFFPLDLRVAHFDHAWREEGKEESLALKEKVEALGLKFYSKRSSLATWQEPNKEDRAREERFSFFETLYEEVGAQALILAHQREDSAETVLKRLLEGAGITSLGGMEPKSFYKGMVLWRPLLMTPRKELLGWNEKKGLVAVEDCTNQDLQFLRPRMRSKIFPELEKWFGKGAQKNLALLGEEFSSLKQYMKKRLKPYLEQKVEGPLGFALLSDTFASLDSFERRELVKSALLEKGVRIGRDALKRVEALLKDLSCDKLVDVSRGELIVDRGSLFWLSKPLKGSWDWKIEKGEKKEQKSSFLQAFFLGQVRYLDLEEKDLVLCDYSCLESKEKKGVDSFFSQNKIPSRMREIFPFVKKDNRLVSVFDNVNNSLFTNETNYELNINLKNT